SSTWRCGQKRPRDEGSPSLGRPAPPRKRRLRRSARQPKVRGGSRAPPSPDKGGPMSFEAIAQTPCLRATVDPHARFDAVRAWMWQQLEGGAFPPDVVDPLSQLFAGRAVVLCPRQLVRLLAVLGPRALALYVVVWGVLSARE